MEETQLSPYALYEAQLSEDTILCESPEHKREFILQLADDFCSGRTNQYIVEEAVAAGIEEILIITGRGKAIMEDHFDHAFELERNLEANPAKAQMLEQCLGIANLADIFFLRQKETKGLGHAILKAKPFTADEPFVVLYGDDVIMGDDPVAAQLIRAYGQTGKP